MQVFEDEQHWLAFSVFQEDRYQRFQGLLSLALWGEVERRIMILRRNRHREQRRKELHRLL